MRKEKTYSLLNVKFLFFSLIVFILLFILVLITIGSLKILTNFGENIKISIAGILYFALNLFMVFFIGRIFYMYISYTWRDLKTSVKIDFENESLTICKNSKCNVIESKDIERVELYLSTSNYRSLMRYFEYVKLTTKDNKEYVVTNFVIDCSIFENIFNSVKKTKKLSDIIFLK